MITAVELGSTSATRRELPKIRALTVGFTWRSFDLRRWQELPSLSTEGATIPLAKAVTLTGSTALRGSNGGAFVHDDFGSVGEPQIRPVRQTDWPGILQVEESRYGKSGYDPYFVRMIPFLFARTCWVASSDEGQLEGYSLGAIEDDRPDCAWLMSVVVRRDGTGLGTRLSSACIDSLERRGAKQIRVTVAPDNLPAIRLYSKLQFRTLDLEKNFFGPGMDRLLMEKSVA